MSFSTLLGMLFIIGLIATASGYIQKNKSLRYLGISFICVLMLLCVYMIFVLPDAM